MLLRQLQYAVTVARVRNFTKASELCCITQPTLSHQIKVLEDYLGLQLFDRNLSPVGITPEGEVFLNRAQDILQEATALEALAASLANDQTVVPIKAAQQKLPVKKAWWYKCPVTAASLGLFSKAMPEIELMAMAI